MKPILDPPRITVDVPLADREQRTLADDVRDGLTRPAKELPPKHFYDARGSELFDAICELPEYYPTRTERAILESCAEEIVALTGAAELVELGSGSATKTRVLLDAMAAAGTLRRYVPVDVSETVVRASADALTEEYPGLVVHGLVGDFERHLGRLPAPAGPRLVCFLGGTIGNFGPTARRRLLSGLARHLGHDGHLLLGADLVKDPAVLEAAYDDSAGVTAAFNRNVLAVVNRELDADFDLDAFEHVARYDADEAWIEMRLRARDAQHVRIEALDLDVRFAAGEDVRTEISAKFTRDRLADELAAAGLEPAAWRTDASERFVVLLARAAR